MAAKTAQAGNQNLAIYYYRQALLQEPGRADWRFWVAQALAKRGNTELALDEARAVLAGQPGHSQALALVAELTKPVVVKSQEQVEKEEEDQAIASVPFPTLSEERLPRVLAAWILGDPAEASEKVNTHNLAASKSQQINVLFVPAGTLDIENGKVLLSLDTAACLAVADAMAQDVRIFPWIRGKSRGWQKVSQAEWAKAGAALAAKAESDSRLAGLFLDVDPHVTVLHLLYAETKKGTQKILMAAGGERMTFKYVDIGVARCFGYGGERVTLRRQEDGRAMMEEGAVAPDLRVYAGNVEATAGGFLRNARSMGGQAILGVPFTATAQEHEARAESPEGTRVPVSVKMEDYVANGLGWVEASVQVNDNAFLGLAIWAIMPEGGYNPPGDLLFYFPSAISPGQWQRLKLPLINR